MDDDGITLLVGEEVFDGYEYSIEELKTQLKTNEIYNMCNSIGSKMMKIENSKDAG